MSSDKSKPAEAPKGKNPPANPPAPTGPTPPLFRTVDWVTFAITALMTFIGYWITLAPDLTLEDAGELATGSFYAGVPHPPGYPVWTIYTWLFTLIPYSNIAWRVALSSAVAASVSCGMLGLLVSRCSTTMLESIPDFKNIERKWENAICVVSGFVAAMLLGYNGFMWSQAVIVEVYTLSVVSFMAVLVSLFRWTYAPADRKHLYWAAFWFGVCFTNHQTLIVAAMGIEVVVLLAQPKLGRDVFLANSAIYLIGLMAKATGKLTAFDNNVPLFTIYNVVGLGSILTAGSMVVKLGKPFSEWKPVLITMLLWVAGAAFYFYMPLASMTNPPLNWGYPRTVEGFVHALTRGQYDKTNPTDSLYKFIEQAGMYLEGATHEFTLVYLLIGLVPFFFYSKMQKRERAWVVGLTSIGVCLALLLLLLLNPNTDKQSREQTKVFFTSSHIVISILVGYGLTMIGGILATQYERLRGVVLWSGAAAVGMEVYNVARKYEETLDPILRFSAVFGLGLAAAFLALILIGRKRAHIGVALALFTLMPTRSILSHWADNEQRGHLFGYWFGHDMFTPPFTGSDGKPIYPQMATNAVLFGGTDPGRFNPTYMIFCESFIPARCKPMDPEFNRRDVFLITQNALADKTYLDYIRAHYNRSLQKDPYFFSELFRSEREREVGLTNMFSKIFLPLDRFFTTLGANIEAKRRAEGVYPRMEINTPTPEDSSQSFQDYIVDAQRRLQHDMQFPQEPKQIRPGEDVRLVENRVQVSGQVAVMAINGLLTKVIFDKNPNHEFYVEESFPLDWMFPYLTPFGIIMKINREPVPEITDEMVRKDHEFWSKYMDRTIGNWITYDTSVKEICEFAERVYLHHDYKGFKGDLKFIRDDFAQKAFSKLRSAIGGVYSWRLAAPKNAAEQQRMLKEADFALRQSYAMCPLSPEAVQKYVFLLLSSGRMEDALLVAETSLKFDRENGYIAGLVNQLKSMRQNQTQSVQIQNQFAQLDQQYRANPTNVALGLQLAGAYAQAQRLDAAGTILDQITADPNLEASNLLSVAQIYAQMGVRTKLDKAIERLSTMTAGLAAQYRANSNNIPLAFQLVSIYLVTQKTNEAIEMVDELVARPQADPSTLLSAAQVFAQLQLAPKLESTLQKLVTVLPGNAEAWYDLATVQATMGKNAETLQSLAKALQFSKARVERKEPGAKDLTSVAENDTRFAALKNMPEFKKLLKQK